jgi:hypothetical protein
MSPTLTERNPSHGQHAPVASAPTDHTTDHLLACLEAWSALGGDRQAEAIRAELVERGVPYSDFATERELAS